MPVQKRRIVYLSDGEWADVQARARKRGITASALMRFLIAERDGPVEPLKQQLGAEPMDAEIRARAAAVKIPQPEAKGMSQADRDAVLRKINRGDK